MNAMTRQQQKFGIVRLAGAALLIIAVWGATGMQAQTPSAVVAAHSESAVAALGDDPPPAPAPAPAPLELMVGQSTVLDVGAPIARVSLTRSEERRVGKEGRWRWARGGGAKMVFIVG